jgi:hypothetical protein
LPHEIRRAGKEDAAFLFRRFDAERDRQVRFAGPDRAGENQILRRRDPRATRERVDLRRADALGRGEVERVERLHFGEARLVEPLADHGFVPRRVLGTQDLVEIVFVGPVGIARLPGQALKRPCHARQLQRARVCDDEVPHDRGRAHAGTPKSQSS